jgi:hypothetical protein
MLVNSFQTYIGSAFASHPVRWIESPETTRSQSGIDKIAEKPVEKVADPDKDKPQSLSGDVLDLSQAAQKALETSQSDSKLEAKDRKAEIKKADTEKADTEKTDAKKLEKSEESEKAEKSVAQEKSPISGKELTAEEQQQVKELKARDQEVRVHEMAHVMAGGSFVTSGPSYEYEVGPDGKGYAVGGSVGIDTGAIAGDPEATIRKMQTVAAAALAPAKPSGQDYKVAAAARQAEAKAQMELSRQRTEELTQPAKSEQSEKPGQTEEKSASAFSVVRPADKATESSPFSTESVDKSLVRATSEFAPGAAYKAQSTMSLASPRFSAFA